MKETTKNNKQNKDFLTLILEKGALLIIGLILLLGLRGLRKIGL